MTDGSVTVWPAPPGEELSADFAVRVAGRDVPVLVTRVAPRDPELRWKAMDDKADSARYFEKASFVSFDMTGTVRVEVSCPGSIGGARVLPSSSGIVPSLEGNRLTFELSEPAQVVVEVDGDWVHSLQVFANPPEEPAPRPDDPEVIWFGPGVHEITHLSVGTGKTVYVAGGALVRGIIGSDEPFRISAYSGLRTYTPTIHLDGAGITVRGRGIIDGSGSTTHARNLILATGSDIRIEGVVLRDSSTWNIPIRGCDRVTVRNVKILGYRANSDGIDVCSSRDVVVEDCFLRTLDDLIVVKTDPGGDSKRIVARRCVLWNEVAHALSIGAELRADVDDVLFEDCDVIHDKGREWTLRIFHCDSARVGNVRFERLRIEESRALISLWINEESWSRDAERGHIRGVVFRDVDVRAEGGPRVELLGFDRQHVVENVSFRNVTINGRPLSASDITRNAFVRDVRVEP